MESQPLPQFSDGGRQAPNGLDASASEGKIQNYSQVGFFPSHTQKWIFQSKYNFHIIDAHICCFICKYIIFKFIRAKLLSKLNDMLSNFDDFRIFFRLIPTFNTEISCVYTNYSRR